VRSLATAILLLVATESGLAQDLARGRAAFTRCSACHSLEPGDGPKPGPSLIGVVGRPAASLPDFEYSPVLADAGGKGLVWSEENLLRFMADSEAFLPGTVMGLVRVPTEADRRALLELLEAEARSQKPEGKVGIPTSVF
jgi:cytochrome c